MHGNPSSQAESAALPPPSAVAAMAQGRKSLATGIMTSEFDSTRKKGG